MNKAIAGDLSGLPEQGLVIVGFSGGADSTALAHWLFTQIDPKRLVLAHVNHLLRGEEAERDQAAARAFAQSLGLRFELLRADVKALAKEKGMGLEECGRAVRYGFFEALAPGENDRILTAHTASDNAETLLWNLCRGAGLSGLCGIPYCRGKVLRPFLKVTREEIESYCESHGLPFVTDSTNRDEGFARNRLRLEVLPVLKSLNPQAVKAMSQTAALLSRDRDFLREEARRLLEEARRPYGLDAKTLLGAPEALRAFALREWLEELGFSHVEKRHFDEIDRILKEGGAAPIPGKGLVRCKSGLLYLDRGEAEQAFSVPVGLGETVLPGGKTLILEKKPVNSGKSTQKIHNLVFKNALDCAIISFIARSPRPGDRFSPAGRGLTKPVGKLLGEAGIPASRRKNAVLLECQGKLAYCQGVGAAEGFQIREDTKEAVFVSLRENEGKIKEKG